MESQPELSGTDNCANKGYDITFDHVSFSYQDGETVLKNVSFTAKQGEVTALVGPSGSGKSTAVKLATRFGMQRVEKSDLAASISGQLNRKRCFPITQLFFRM